MVNSAFVSDAPQRLWLPEARELEPRARKVALAVREYDDSFRFGQHQVTGDWVVCIKNQPVFGFGRELPHPDDVPKILARHDMKRRGHEIMDELDRKNKADQAEREYQRQQNTGIVAEHFEHAFRQEGRHPVPRIFVPRGVSKPT